MERVTLRGASPFFMNLAFKVVVIEVEALAPAGGFASLLS